MKLCLISLLSCATLVGAQEAVAQSDEQRSEPCVPAALLRGDPVLVSQLQQQLSLLGVSDRGQAGCPLIEAKVAASEEGIAVVLQEASGRNASIVLSDASIAATWIDSWLQEELGAPLLAIRAAPTEASAAPPAILPDLERDTPIVPASEVAAARALRFGLSYENTSTDNDADWRGLRAEACLEVGPTCLGFLAHVSETKNKLLSSDEFAAFSQSSVSALASLKIPVAIGRSHLVPHLAMGGSWLKSSRQAATTDCGPVEGPNCVEPFFEDSAKSRSTLAPEIESGLSLSLPLASQVHLQLGTSLTLRPFGEKAASVNGPTAPPPCPEPNDPDCGDFESPSIEAMPSEPERFWRLSIGLQVEL